MNKTNRVIGSAIAMAIVILLIPALVIPSVTAQQTGLTGNWVVRTPRGDGTDRTTYFNLKDEGSRITGTIWLVSAGAESEPSRLVAKPPDK